MLGLRPAGRSGSGSAWTTPRGSPVVPEVKTISAGSSGAIASTAAGVSCGRSSSRTRGDVGHVIAGTPSGSSASSSSSPTQSFGSAAATRSSRSWRRSCVLQGSATAPIRQQASSASTHSIRLPTSVITTSPRRTPRAAKAPESPARAGDQLAEVPVAPACPRRRWRRSPAARPGTAPSLPR